MLVQYGSAVLMAALGAIMLVSSLGAKLVGMPRQIKRNFRTKTAPHSLKWFMWFGMAAYSSQTVWCLLREEWLLAAAQGPGIVTTGIFLWQIARYADAQPTGPDKLGIVVGVGPLFELGKPRRHATIVQTAGRGLLIVPVEGFSGNVATLPAVVDAWPDGTGAPRTILQGDDGCLVAVADTPATYVTSLALA